MAGLLGLRLGMELEIWRGRISGHPLLQAAAAGRLTGPAGVEYLAV
jgi:hypothetical protein